MMFIPNTSIRSMTGVLLSLCFLSSCDKPSHVPKDVIRSASQNWAPDEPGEQIGFIAGEPLISDGSFGVKGKPIYPVRTVFQVTRKVPVSWDKLTGLPRLPQESETARAYVELEYTANEFGEWSSRYRGKGWAYPAKIREVVEQALQEAEDQYAVSRGNTSQSRREFKQAQQQDKARRYRKAEQEPEFRKMKAGQPFENGYRAFHYWMPVEYDAWEKRKASAKSGSASAKEKKQASVKKGFTSSAGIQMLWVDKGYYLAATEVTQTQWQTLIVDNDSHFQNPSSPVENVSWGEAMTFCHYLTKQDRMSGELPEGYVYMLPTEEQWEYACRAGSVKDYAGQLDLMAWYGANSGGRSHEVATKQPNAWGFYDMHGNVWEWCFDSHDDNRIYRGGGWETPAQYCKSSYRGMSDPFDTFFCLGFRIAAVSSTQAK